MKFVWTEEYLREHFANCDCCSFETDSFRASATVHLSVIPGSAHYWIEVSASHNCKNLETTEILKEGEIDRKKVLARAEQLMLQLGELLMHWEKM